MTKHQRKLVAAEIRYGYLQLSTLGDHLPFHSEPVTIIDPDGEVFKSKMHSQQNRIDGLTKLYKKHGLKSGHTITVETNPREPAVAHVFFRGHQTKASVAKLKQMAKVSQKADVQALEKSIRSGAGFGSPERNRQVEQAAVKYVTEWHKGRGWHVTSVEAEKRGYDLHCRKRSIEEHIEVKGVQGKLPLFIITAGEVRQSKKNSSFVICVVTSALSKNPKLFRYTAREFSKYFDLTPLAYRASVKK